jgi:hypothetical protein
MDIDNFDHCINKAAEAMENQAKQYRESVLIQQVSNLNDVLRTLTRQQSTLHRFLVTTGTILFGLLVSLGNKSDNAPVFRLLFSLVLFLLSIGILVLTISLFEQIYCLKKEIDLLILDIAAGSACRNKPPFRSIKKSKIFATCTTTGYICFAAAILLLSVYALLLAIL